MEQRQTQGEVKREGDKTGARYHGGTVRVGNHHCGAARVANHHSRAGRGKNLMAGGTMEQEMAG